MRIITMLSTWYLVRVVGAFMCIALFCAVQAEAAVVAGYAKNVQGEVQALLQGEARKLDEMSPIYVQDEIETGSDSGAHLVMIDESSVLVGPTSKMTVADMGYLEVGGKVAGKTAMGVKAVSGAFRFVTGKVAKANPENFQVETPLGTIGVRGTDFSSLLQSGMERHRLNEGGPLVVADRVGGHETISNAGFGVELRPGQPVGPSMLMGPVHLSQASGKVSLAQVAAGFDGLTGNWSQQTTNAVTPVSDLPTQQVFARAVSAQASRIANADLLERIDQLQVRPKVGTFWISGANGSPRVFNNAPYMRVMFSNVGGILTAPFPGINYGDMRTLYGLQITDSLTNNELSYTGFGSFSVSENAAIAAYESFLSSYIKSLNDAGYSSFAGQLSSTYQGYRSGQSGTALWSYGVPTTADLPTSGVSTYNGTLTGLHFTDGVSGVSSGSVVAKVDFGQDKLTSIVLNFTNAPISQLTGSGTLSRDSNSGYNVYNYSAQLQAAGSFVYQQGSATGPFNGPNGSEIGGSYTWYGTSAAHVYNMYGVFGAKR